MHAMRAYFFTWLTILKFKFAANMKNLASTSYETDEEAKARL